MDTHWHERPIYKERKPSSQCKWGRCGHPLGSNTNKDWIVKKELHGKKSFRCHSRQIRQKGQAKRSGKTVSYVGRDGGRGQYKDRCTFRWAKWKIHLIFDCLLAASVPWLRGRGPCENVLNTIALSWFGNVQQQSEKHRSWTELQGAGVIFISLCINGWDARGRNSTNEWR